MQKNYKLWLSYDLSKILFLITLYSSSFYYNRSVVCDKLAFSKIQIL